MARTLRIHVDGEEHSVAADPSVPLLYVLRNELGKHAPRFGCGLAQCGACTVLKDGVPVRSCTLPVGAAQGKIRTLEGLSANGRPHPVQSAFIEEEAGQCGYCLSGWILTAVALLEGNPRPSEAEIRDALAGLKCRCAAHMSILRAIRRAAREIAASAEERAS
jgi:aerobic-type carbon monoxide dehydrogenase small subunit (CoxS/CutS family)